MLRLIAIFALVSAVAAAAAGVISGIVIKGTIDAGIRTQQQKLRVVQVRACFRQNARQAAQNQNALATWREDSLFASALLVRPSTPRTVVQRRLVRRFHERLVQTVATLTWTPLNHQCATSPTVVLLPVPFSSRQPTKTDLSVL